MEAVSTPEGTGRASCELLHPPHTSCCVAPPRLSPPSPCAPIPGHHRMLLAGRPVPQQCDRAAPSPALKGYATPCSSSSSSSSSSPPQPHGAARRRPMELPTAHKWGFESVLKTFFSPFPSSFPATGRGGRLQPSPPGSGGGGVEAVGGHSLGVPPFATSSKRRRMAPATPWAQWGGELLPLSTWLGGKGGGPRPPPSPAALH